jgi:tRNA(Ile)-lysidine synthase
MMSLKKRVEKSVQQARGHPRPFSAADPLLVGVSGGPDSLALLHLLKGIYDPTALVVVHLNHQLRPGAAVEADMVARTAAEWGIAFFVQETDVAALAQMESLSLEEAGRFARYRFFAAMAGEVGARYVAVAHNADDQVETILMHLLRGSGLAGLRGMAPLSPLPGAPGLNLIRPLLHTSRAEIEAYCREQLLEPAEDSSNQDIAFLRNRLRHELLPLLSQINPQIRRSLQNTASLIAADYGALELQLLNAWAEILRQEGHGWLSLDRSAWLEMPLSLRRSLLRHGVALLRPHLRDIPFRPIELARLLVERGQSGKQASLPGGLSLHVQYDQIILADRTSCLPTHWPQLPALAPLPLTIPGQARLDNEWTLEATLVTSPKLGLIEKNRDPWIAFVAVADETLHVRPRQPGERFQPLGLDGRSARLKEVMINRRIPADLRHNWPIVSNDAHLLWLTGHQIDERARVTPLSQRVVKLHCRPGGDNTGTVEEQ